MFQYSIKPTARTTRIGSRYTSLAWLHFEATRALVNDPAVPDLFIDKLIGDKPEKAGDATIALRKRYLQWRTADAWPGRANRIAIEIRAFGHFARGHRVGQLVAKRDLAERWEWNNYPKFPTNDDLAPSIIEQL